MITLLRSVIYTRNLEEGIKSPFWPLGSRNTMGTTILTLTCGGELSYVQIWCYIHVICVHHHYHMIHRVITIMPA